MLRMLLVWTLATAWGGCSLDTGSAPMGNAVCDPGATQVCVCAGGVTGGQSCNEGGTAWEECQCDAAPAPGEGEGEGAPDPGPAPGEGEGEGAPDPGAPGGGEGEGEGEGEAGQPLLVCDEAEAEGPCEGCVAPHPDQGCGCRYAGRPDRKEWLCVPLCEGDEHCPPDSPDDLICDRRDGFCRPRNAPEG